MPAPARSSSTRPHGALRRALTTGFALVMPALLACSDRITDPAHVQTSAANDVQVLATGLSTSNWMAHSRVLVALNSQSPLTGARTYALLAIAQYGAIVDADNLPNGDATAKYEARRGAIAGASAQLLSFIFPASAAALERRLNEDARAGPSGPHPQFTAGVALGRAFGDVMILWAQTDGVTKPWTGTIPVGAGFWTSAPGVAPAGASFATATPYFLTSQGQFHPPLPPAFGSTAFLANLAEVSSISLNRTPTQLAIAVFWNLSTGSITPVGYWNQLAGRFIEQRRFDERAAAHVLALANAAAVDAIIGCWEAKFSYFYIRPSQANPAITLPIGLPNHPSYPSGHSCVSAASVEILKAFFPEHSATLSAQLAEAGKSRVLGGIHYPFDIGAGQALGRAVGQWAWAYDQANGLLSAVR